MLSYMYGLERKEAFDDDKNVNFLKSKKINGCFKVETYANFFSFLLSLNSGDGSTLWEWEVNFIDHDSLIHVFFCFQY